jgi:hypothetical protein
MGQSSHIALIAALFALGGCELIVGGGATSASGTATGTAGSSSGNSSASSGGPTGTASTGSTAGASSTGGISTGSTSGSASTGTSSSSSSSGGSTGTVCTYGSTGAGQSAGCSSSPTPGPISDWLTGPVPDSTPWCEGGCSGNGEDGDRVMPRSNICSAFFAQYVDSTTQMSVEFVADTRTGIMWQSDPVFESQTFDQALQTCSPGNWRFSSNTAVSIGLPHVADLVALLDLGADGGLPAGLGGKGEIFWAVAERADSGVAYWVDASSGDFTPFTPPLIGAASVRCVLGDVRAVQVKVACAPSADGYQDCALVDGANDPITGLEFHTNKPSSALGWSDALAFCNALQPCGKFRLPSYKELLTLANFTTEPVGNAFIDANNNSYWSSTPVPGQPGSALTIQFANPSRSGQAPRSVGLVEAKTSAQNVLCVSGP